MEENRIMAILYARFAAYREYKENPGVGRRTGKPSRSCRRASRKKAQPSINKITYW